MHFSKFLLATGLFAAANAAVAGPVANAAPISKRASSFASSCGQKDGFPIATADGWKHVKLAGGLTTPRGVAVDPTNGNLLIVERYKGITGFQFSDNGCVKKKVTIVKNDQLNHGIAISPGGKYLFASSQDIAWMWDYDSATMKATNRRVVIKNIEAGEHTTRTLFIPPLSPFHLVVSKGGDGNLDAGAVDKSNSRAVVKSFFIPLAPKSGFDWKADGIFLGYGLRNDVGIVADGNNNIWSVENSADRIVRTVGGKTTDIHNGNPAEELNFLGNPTVANEKWYGYPTCFTVWNGKQFPGSSKPKTGSQFIPAPNASFTDATCEQQSQAPRLTFEAHGAPIDATFNQDFSSLTVTLHGSFNTNTPTGYKIVQVPFKKDLLGLLGYEPVADQDSQDGYTKILWDTNTKCDATICLRPAGITWDNKFSRMFFTSDATQGEVYMLYQT